MLSYFSVKQNTLCMQVLLLLHRPVIQFAVQYLGDPQMGFQKVHVWCNGRWYNHSFILFSPQTRFSPVTKTFIDFITVLWYCILHACVQQNQVFGIKLAKLFH